MPLLSLTHNPITTKHLNLPQHQQNTQIKKRQMQLKTLREMIGKQNELQKYFVGYFYIFGG